MYGAIVMSSLERLSEDSCFQIQIALAKMSCFFSPASRAAKFVVSNAAVLLCCHCPLGSVDFEKPPDESESENEEDTSSYISRSRSHAS